MASKDKWERKGSNDWIRLIDKRYAWEGRGDVKEINRSVEWGVCRSGGTDEGD